MIKISWKPLPGETGASLVLAKPAPERGPGSMIATTRQRAFGQTVQSVEYPRSEAIDTFGRQNLRTSYGFSVHATFNTVSECEQYCDDLGAMLATGGTLELSYTGGGQRSITGVWTAIDAVTSGVSAVINYQFIGGSFLAGPSSNQVPTI